MWRKYGLSVEDYAWMLHAQGFVCAICLKPPKKDLAVDHNHKSGEVRGLVCVYCNWKVLGQMERAGPERTLKAFHYLWPHALGRP
jgi:DNA-directed RNA polymerase subunit RPC12/RpoP